MRLENQAALAQTVIAGDRSYAGPLAGVPLGLPVFHVFEPEVRDQVPGDVYEAQVALRSHPRRAARGAAGRGDDVMRRPSADDLGRAPAHAPRGHPRAVTAVAARDHQDDPVRARDDGHQRVGIRLVHEALPGVGRVIGAIA